ncbi:hypothetical protein FGO68_gene10002 [Halteria grandinella]|uniref:Uncharacterized protein n=1 Tax=Halteria grandinella TaxID=5974 RepID=A0A8J8NWW7_HALGN|nr:hypothetical protein FGO68_gene10002 [Halteria grandinella]
MKRTPFSPIITTNHYVYSKQTVISPKNQENKFSLSKNLLNDQKRIAMTTMSSPRDVKCQAHTQVPHFTERSSSRKPSTDHGTASNQAAIKHREVLGVSKVPFLNRDYSAKNINSRLKLERTQAPAQVRQRDETPDDMGGGTENVIVTTSTNGTMGGTFGMQNQPSKVGGAELRDIKRALMNFRGGHTGGTKSTHNLLMKTARLVRGQEQFKVSQKENICTSPPTLSKDPSQKQVTVISLENHKRPASSSRYGGPSENQSAQSRRGSDKPLTENTSKPTNASAQLLSPSNRSPMTLAIKTLKDFQTHVPNKPSEGNDYQMKHGTTVSDLATYRSNLASKEATGASISGTGYFKLQTKGNTIVMTDLNKLDEAQQANDYDVEGGTAPTDEDIDCVVACEMNEEPKRHRVALQDHSGKIQQRLRLNLDSIMNHNQMSAGTHASAKGTISQRGEAVKQATIESNRSAVPVSDHQMYQGYNHFLSASEMAVTRMSQVQQTLVKKLEAKRVELLQAHDVIDTLSKTNTEIQRFLDIYAQRNQSLEDTVLTHDTKLSQVTEEINYRENQLRMNDRRVQGAQNATQWRDELLQREAQTLETLKRYEDALKESDLEYEAVRAELYKAQQREEGMLKVLGSTIKDTFQKNLGSPLMKGGGGKMVLPTFHVKSPKSNK